MKMTLQTSTFITVQTVKRHTENPRVSSTHKKQKKNENCTEPWRRYLRCIPLLCFDWSPGDGSASGSHAFCHIREASAFPEPARPETENLLREKSLSRCDRSPLFCRINGGWDAAAMGASTKVLGEGGENGSAKCCGASTVEGGASGEEAWVLLRACSAPPSNPVEEGSQAGLRDEGHAVALGTSCSSSCGRPFAWC